MPGFAGTLLLATSARWGSALPPKLLIQHLWHLRISSRALLLWQTIENCVVLRRRLRRLRTFFTVWCPVCCDRRLIRRCPDNGPRFGNGDRDGAFNGAIHASILPGETAKRQRFLHKNSTK
jgi:hypothetical protein